MANVEVQLVVLCEDKQHESFAIRVLKALGWPRGALRTRVSPQGRGAGEAWVRRQFPAELKAIRSRGKRSRQALIAVVDLDRVTYRERVQQFNNECDAIGVAVLGAEDQAIIAAPGRNIESWIRWLDGEDVDGVTEYPKLARESGCWPAAERLASHCKAGKAFERSTPPGLGPTCNAFKLVLQN